MGKNREKNHERLLNLGNKVSVSGKKVGGWVL